LKALLVQRPSAAIRNEQSVISKERIREHFNWPRIVQEYLEAFQAMQ